MNKKVRKLKKKGVGLNLALLLCWKKLTKEEKKSLTFEQLLGAWEDTPKESPERADAWQLLKKKAQTFEQLQQVLKMTPSGPSVFFSPEERVEFLKLLKEKAQTFEHLQWLFRLFHESALLLSQKMNGTFAPEGAGILKSLKKKAQIFEQFRWIWENVPSDSPVQDEIWQLLKEKAKTLEQSQWVLEQTPLNDPGEDEASKLFIERIQILEQFLGVWKRARSRLERTKAWQSLEKEAETFEELLWVWRNVYPDKSRAKARLLKLLREKANF